jgi:hypothetical protein
LKILAVNSHFLKVKNPKSSNFTFLNFTFHCILKCNSPVKYVIFYF